jgi:hypothetical protein
MPQVQGVVEQHEREDRLGDGVKVKCRQQPPPARADALGQRSDDRLFDQLHRERAGKPDRQVARLACARMFHPPPQRAPSFQQPQAESSCSK